MEQDRVRRAEVDLSRGMEKELQKKLVQYQRTIRSLNQQIEEDKSRCQDRSAKEELNQKYLEKCEECDDLKIELEKVKAEAISDKERYGTIWKILMNYYYDYQRRGVRRPLNKIEIEKNPERFVVELLFGVFEAHPSRFRKAIKKNLGGSANQRSRSFFAADTDTDDLHDESISILPEDQKWWSTQNAAYLSSKSPDFEVLQEPIRSASMSTISAGAVNTNSRRSSTSKSAGVAPASFKNASSQTIESSFSTDMNPVEESTSITSSNFVIDSFSAPNLKSGGSGMLSSSGRSMFCDNFGVESVDRRMIGGNKLKKYTNRRRDDPIKFAHQKRVHKKVTLPKLNNLSDAPVTHDVSLGISGAACATK